MTRRAFRFLGHMALRTNSISQGVASKNIFQVVLQAGANVLEMTGEIIRYNETMKQTAYIADTIEKQKTYLEEKYAANRTLAQDQVANLKQELLLALQLEEKKLQRSLETYKQQIETKWLIDQTAVIENHEGKQMLFEMLKTYNMVLALCEKSINETIIEDEIKFGLYEQFRLINKKIHALMQEVN